MTLFARPTFERHVLGLPSATLVRQWRDDSVAKVGGKIFALLDSDGGDIWFKASPLSFDLLVTLDGVRPAPYFARAGWVAVSPQSPLRGEELAAYIAEAHRLIAARLPRRTRAELGLMDWAERQKP